MNTLKTDSPKTIDLSLPPHCISRCKMCYYWRNDITLNDPRWLKIKDYKKLLYDLKDFGENSFFVSFGGGEPLLFAEKLFNIARICKELGFKTYFPTSAYFINKEMAKKIAEAGIYSIGISLESLDKKTHDFIRGRRGSWDKAMQAISHLERNCPDILINILTVIMEENLDGIIDLAKWVYKHPKLYGIFFQAIQKPFNINGLQNWYELKKYAYLWPQDAGKANSIIDELIALRQICRGFKISNPISQLEQFKFYFSNPRQFVRIDKCHLGGNVIRVDCFGNVILCNEMDFIGNIKQNDIRQIWYSKKAGKIRKLIHNCNENCHHLINCYYDGKAE